MNKSYPLIHFNLTKQHVNLEQILCTGNVVPVGTESQNHCTSQTWRAPQQAGSSRQPAATQPQHGPRHSRLAAAAVAFPHCDGIRIPSHLPFVFPLFSKHWCRQCIFWRSNQLLPQRIIFLGTSSHWRKARNAHELSVSLIQIQRLRATTAHFHKALNKTKPLKPFPWSTTHFHLFSLLFPDEISSTGMATVLTNSHKGIQVFHWVSKCLWNGTQTRYRKIYPSNDTYYIQFFITVYTNCTDFRILEVRGFSSVCFVVALCFFKELLLCKMPSPHDICKTKWQLSPDRSWQQQGLQQEARELPNRALTNTQRKYWIKD